MTCRILRRAGQLVALAVMVSMVATACAPSRQDTGGGSSAEVPDTITIGATLPLTGTESKAGGRQ
jgi:branched-chain amino acid transport system substrate-binding protein